MGIEASSVVTFLLKSFPLQKSVHILFIFSIYLEGRLFYLFRKLLTQSPTYKSYLSEYGIFSLLVVSKIAEEEGACKPEMCKCMKIIHSESTRRTLQFKQTWSLRRMFHFNELIMMTIRQSFAWKCESLVQARSDIKKENKKNADNFIKGWRMKQRNTKNIQIRKER